MTPDQALTVLDEMSRRAPGTRDDHIAASHAVQVLRQVIQPKDAPTTPPKNLDRPSE